MISALGLMIGLYILMRYNKMFKNATVVEKAILLIFSLATIVCIISLSPVKEIYQLFQKM